MLEKLKTRQFIREEKGKLIPTETGVAFFRALPESATLPDMTALWSAQQSDIEQGNQTVEEFVNTLLDNLRKLVITVNVSEIKGEAKPNGGQVERLATPCPNCGKDIVVRPKLFTCTGCDFKIWSTVAEKKLTTKQVEALIQKGKTAEIKGFTSKKTSKPFSAILVLQDKTSGKVGFEFAHPTPLRKKPRAF
ncbi:topoisomerase C-terminal repeat-containing protein [Arsenophonus apicola]|uniref:Topoisomerase C-terminal repeat-containing protein n=1 Tax=Arsenophonus apicola TaxID=2879119 RepID=A0ABY8P0A6_9GAMM|nr:topoisomerase C-terminal repeat-containing protein [Arsenophonus apicola]WGO82250.1 topoisomerase C-terminal repeat-containing protein [Arsenophonus apicola]